MQEVQQALPVPRNESVDIDELPDLVARAVRNPCCTHAAIAVADQDDVAQVLILDDVQHIGDMRLEVDRGNGEMRALAESGIAWRHQAMAGLTHQGMHLLPGPAGRPRAVTDQEGFGGRRIHRGVSISLLFCSRARYYPSAA